MSACFCVGPAGDCPCIRRTRSWDWQRHVQDIAHIRPDVLDQMRAEGWFRAGPVPELGTSEPELGTSARTPEPEEWR